MITHCNIQQDDKGNAPRVQAHPSGQLDGAQTEVHGGPTRDHDRPLSLAKLLRLIYRARKFASQLPVVGCGYDYCCCDIVITALFICMEHSCNALTFPPRLSPCYAICHFYLIILNNNKIALIQTWLTSNIDKIHSIQGCAMYSGGLINEVRGWSRAAQAQAAGYQSLTSFICPTE